ncbi:unnamed protein product [Cuscuta campestris]|uniref:Clp R domain-containing protein n=1 Tax=Cuscuta campestris TaxID=132261 RepID=A0A484LVY7_9ASTE|nr:unnamed protein product [Cuscuta campestris]
MPTSVTTARQCLTPEAAKALDDAVAVARRRGHAQTTSVHMVSSLLSLPSSPLREACARTRNAAYSARVQFKALELCLAVSLDRLPASPSPADEPPVSNSLMAAIKRSQANQRRQPESYTFYQPQNSPPSSCSPVIKVEIQNMTVSILDDPAVSRVFGEAGFTSCDIKVALLRPVHQFFRYSTYKGHPSPLFLCNLSPDSNLGRRDLTFPFLGNPAVLEEDKNCRRIWEVLENTNKKNPLLVGVSAHNTLKNFLGVLNRRETGQMPLKLSGLKVVCFETELSGCVNGDYDERMMRFNFEGLKRTVSQCRKPEEGVIVNFGELSVLAVDGVSSEFLVREMGNLVKVHPENLWVIGSVERYEVYLKVLNRFPAFEKDWDLQLLTITYAEPLLGESSSYPKSRLMESFVPLGGFFPATAYEHVKGPPLMSSSNPSTRRCFLCIEKCRQEINALSGEQHSSLPSWLQKSNRMDSIEAKDDKVLLSARIDGVNKKWDSLCHRLHYNLPADQFPSIAGNGETGVSASKESVLSDVNNSATALSMVGETPSNELDPATSSPSSVTSVTMDLGLRICSGESEKSKDGNFDRKDFKILYRALVERVWWQEEAVRVVSQRIARCRRDVWFHFAGEDELGKKKLAVAVSEILSGTTQSLIYVDLTFPEPAATAKSPVDLPVSNRYDVTLRGKPAADFIADKLSENPMSVVFLENIEKADHLLQNSLSRAVKTGKFSDSRGRDVSISNAIFITACGNSSQEEKVNFFSSPRIWPSIQIQVGVDLGDGPNRWDPPKKRAKRAHVGRSPCPDLNFLPEDNEEVEERSKALEPWLEDFLKGVDETVTFKPFDFDSQGKKMLEEIERCFSETVGPECSLEVEREVVERITTAACLTDNKKVEKWIKSVIKQGFMKAQEKYSLTAHSIVKLISGRYSEVGQILPENITLI